MLELHSITWIWPFMLWGLCALPLIMLLYIFLVRRSKQKHAPLNTHWTDSYVSKGAVRSWLSRHGFTLVMALGIGVLLLAMARPRAILLLPSRMETVMLAIDSSGSMRASDVQPSRIEAAQTAARLFVNGQPSHVKLGIVSVAGTAAVVQAPTETRDDLMKAIDNLPLQRGSALGSGIVISLAAMLPASGINVDQLINPEIRPEQNPALTPNKSNQPIVPKIKLEPGANSSAAIVLMTDGQSNIGPDFIKMAQVAADLGVRIYTIGFGTPEGVILKAQGMAMRVKLDEAPLKQVAEMTRGEYFRAASEKDMERIYQSLSMRIVMQKHQMSEVTALFMLVGMLLVTLGGAWSIWRHGRLV